MKNWIDFLPQKTHFLKKKSKILNSLEFDLMEVEYKRQNIIEALKTLDLELQKETMELNKQEEISIAKNKALKWNNTPTNELVNLKL